MTGKETLRKKFRLLDNRETSCTPKLECSYTDWIPVYLDSSSLLICERCRTSVPDDERRLGLLSCVTEDLEASFCSAPDDPRAATSVVSCRVRSLRNRGRILTGSEPGRLGFIPVCFVWSRKCVCCTSWK